MCAGLISCFVNQLRIEEDVRKRLVLSVGQMLQRESLPFQESVDARRNFLPEFADLYARPNEEEETGTRL
jgi:hypothetical protein